MPGMPRLNSKTTKIAYKILGVPANMRSQEKTKREEWIKRRLLMEETSRVR